MDEPPSLEYRSAFDLCAAEVNRSGGPALLHAAYPFHARELFRRIGSLRPAATAGTEEPAAAAIWAEPEGQPGDPILHTFRSCLAPGGRLCVLLSGPLARALPEWAQRGPGPAHRPAGLRRTVHRLRQAGLAVEAVYGFHGPASVAWSYAYRLAEAVGRSDLADRALVHGRACYLVRGWQAHLAPVRVILARQGDRLQ